MAVRGIGRLRAKGQAAGGEFEPFSTEYTAAGTQTVAKPEGAATCTVECYAAGASGNSMGFAGGGGAYSKRNTYDVSGLTGLYLSLPAGPTAENTSGADCFVKENDASGTTVCLAKGGSNSGAGGAAASGTGDVKNSGGAGQDATAEVAAGGGGGAGPDGAGGNGSGGNGGAAGGGMAGAGGDGSPGAGAPAGGGGGARLEEDFGAGSRGAIKLSWA